MPLNAIPPVSEPARVATHAVLDPRSLGRPVHRLASFALLLEDALNSLWAEPLNRRYQAHWHVGGLAFSRGDAPASPGRWLAFRGAAGAWGWRLAREVALGLLAYRYGLPQQAAADAANPAAPTREPGPVTASEERLVQQLGQQVLALLVQCLDRPAGTAPLQPAALADIECLGVVQPDLRHWRLRGELQDSRSGATGALEITLDDACMDRLFKTLEPARTERVRSRGDAANAARPFPHRLGLAMTARLLQKELSLGTLLDLKVGDVLPVRLGATDVLIDDARLFTATVAERQGKLCLTTFEDAE
ncbi:FliM/FliN family flagellar motor C-terminal domain-containing protein [Ideonella azotifigens]|uniref:Flagellar motor switch protein FliN-like C-terminal domain-containing protein n=2 Tax=Ideonella azotifigens TaxID=513160 RepID=A0ABP3VIX9_9BURK|nr:FliM/FliN family flagellar motor C-terminal domain-containing protein [Ideonella azotifigens]MCD2339118.1 FliM/FliN family flagellar motor C-terminal domain-containing protein [Ideonella azotifigens]